MRPNWFIGLVAPLDPAVLDGLVPPPRCRLFHPADLHITVAFLGGVDEGTALSAWEIAAAHTWRPIAATLGEVVPMGPPDRYSALSAELDRGLDEAVALLTALRGPCLEAAHRPPDRWEIYPHLTLARPQRKANDAQRDAILAWGRRLPTSGVPVLLDTLALYTWSADRREKLFTTVRQHQVS